MSVSKQEIPHAWMMVEVDATGLVRYRNTVKDSFKKEEGYSLTYFAFFIKAVAQALKEFPQLNSTWAGDKIIEHANINISIAIAMAIYCMCQLLKMRTKNPLKVLLAK